MNKIRVNASKSYDVLISKGLMKDTGKLIKEIISTCKAAIISDDRVYSLYGEEAFKSLKDVGYEVVSYIFPNGEKSKNLTTYSEILEFLAENHLTRSDIIVALGGGVTGDMAGFAASTYLRGIKFVQIPTTLLASVDSSVGGKTGVNLDAGKNLVGAFHQPSLVICDTDSLKTLDDVILADGVAEAVKCGMIRNKELFDKMGRDFAADIESVIADCVNIKRQVVANDEFDTGERQLLNFGHTIGHAIEKCSGFSISHGKAVAIGMVIITRASEKMGLCPCGTLKELTETLKKCGLGVECPYKAEELYEVALSDKKRSGGNITLVIPKEIGRCVLHKIKADELLEFIKKGIEV